MSNPYTSPTTSNPARVPVVRPVSWPAVIVQIFVLTAAVVLGWLATVSIVGIYWGATAYLVFSVTSRRLLARAHRRGLRLVQAGQFEAAIAAYEASYAFFARHRWLDRFRAVTMLSCAGMSYREMALISIAFAYGQIGNGEKVKEYYQRALDEFPNSAMAGAALRMIDSLAPSPVAVEGGK